MKILTYNVNGIRAALKKGFIEWLKASDADVICIQETKAQIDQLDLSVFEEIGYQSFWFSAEKKGYSGVCILSKSKPNKVVKGIDSDIYDIEGRNIRVDFDNCSVMSVYVPSGSNMEKRLEYKMNYCHEFYNYIKDLKTKIPNLIICGDINICHKEIDIHDPKRNVKVSGFLPMEREWLSSFINLGFKDSFRVLNQQPDSYTWWSYRANARQNNKGWRLDYQFVSDEISDKIKSVRILNKAYHSDHCPQLLEMAY